MAGTLIQFRLSDDEIAALAAFQHNGESASLAAKQIVLNVTNGNQITAISNQSNQLDYQEIIERKIEELESDLYSRLSNQLNELLETRLGESVA